MVKLIGERFFLLVVEGKLGTSSLLPLIKYSNKKSEILYFIGIHTQDTLIS